MKLKERNEDELPRMRPLVRNREIPVAHDKKAEKDNVDIERTGSFRDFPRAIASMSVLDSVNLRKELARGSPVRAGNRDIAKIILIGVILRFCHIER